MANKAGSTLSCGPIRTSRAAPKCPASSLRRWFEGLVLRSDADRHPVSGDRRGIFKLEGGFKSCIEVIPGPRLLDLAKSSDGKVNKDKTANKVKSLIRDYAFEKDKKTKLSEDDATNAFRRNCKKNALTL